MLIWARGNQVIGYRGVVRDNDDRRDVLVCPHRHMTTDEARDCARTMLLDTKHRVRAS